MKYEHIDLNVEAVNRILKEEYDKRFPELNEFNTPVLLQYKAGILDKNVVAASVDKKSNKIVHSYNKHLPWYKVIFTLIRGQKYVRIR